MLRQYLYKSISRHTISRSLLNVNTGGLNLLAYLELIDINVFNLRIKLIILLYNNANSLLIITLDYRCIIKLKINASKESHLLLYL